MTNYGREPANPLHHEYLIDKLDGDKWCVSIKQGGRVLAVADTLPQAEGFVAMLKQAQSIGKYVQQRAEEASGTALWGNTFTIKPTGGHGCRGGHGQR